MGEALRDAYARACIEHTAACDALEAAKLRVRRAREECERLEAALQMTGLSGGIFPQLGCALEQPARQDVVPSRKRRGSG